MSLLADLLSKVKHQEQKRDIPPHLKRVIADAAMKRRQKRRIIFFSSLLLLALIGGFGTIYFMERYLKPSVKTLVQKRVETFTQQPAAIPVPAPLSPRSEDVQKPVVPSAQTPSQRQENAIAQLKEQLAKIPLDAATPVEKPQESRQGKAATQGEKKAEAPRGAVEAKSAELPVLKITESTVRETPAESSELYLYAARTYEGKGDYKQALTNYKKALELSPRNYVVMNNIASTLINLGSYEEAVRYAKDSLEIKREYAPALVNLGIAHIKLNKPGEGEGYLQKALGVESSNASGLFNLGILQEKQKEYEKAYKTFFKLVEAGNAQGYMGMARVLERQGKIADAVRVYREAVTTSSVPQEIQRAANERLLQLGY